MEEHIKSIDVQEQLSQQQCSGLSIGLLFASPKLQDCRKTWQNEASIS
jgi:hypothetical protein